MPMTMKIARATAWLPAAAPVWAIAEAAPTTSIRFFGFTAASGNAEGRRAGRG